MASSRNKVILRKLFVAITSLALKLGTQTPSQWPDWLASSVQGLSALGASTESLLDYLAIVAEEIEGADLVGSHKAAMKRNLMDGTPMVTQAITACTSRPRPHPSPQELRSALKCFAAWLPFLPANDITPFIPLLITLMTPSRPPPHSEFDEDEFVLASDAIQEILSRSALSDGAGSKILTEPLLLWCDVYGGIIMEQTLSAGGADGVSHSLCKLLTAIGDHSNQYLASNLAVSVVPQLLLPDVLKSYPIPTKAHLATSYLKLLMGYTSLPGFYGADEDESEMTLGFWYLFQEALWASSDHESDPEPDENDFVEKKEKEQWLVAKAVYTELVKVLRRKVVWPSASIQQTWAKDQVDKFQAYRRDVGDTLINAYYVLRDDMLGYYVSDTIDRLGATQNRDVWEDTEKSKVLQSISSVIEALPPAEQISPIEAMLSPVVTKLFELPEEARAVAIEQLLIISGVAKGLTRTTDSLLVSDESPDVQAQTEKMRLAREDPRVVRLRDAVLDAIRRTLEMWSTDASVCDALSDVFKAITALPSDLTLLSLPAGPLLGLICVASQRQLTAVWLSLATMLTIQLDPPNFLPGLFKKSPPDTEVHTVVLNVVAVLLQAALNLFSQSGAMQDNPDIVQSFFTFDVEQYGQIAQHFVPVFYQLPQDLFNALVQCAVTALSMQERYSLVSTCNFLGTLINRTISHENLSESKNKLVQAHGRSILQALLSGFAGVAPRSATPNLIELLSTMVTRFPAESKVWMAEILYSPEFTPSQATPEAKDRFVKTVFSGRSLRRTRDAAQQFTLVARGLEGSNFGYATVSM
ncbi:hypothetical protein EUX98_g7175 [Antrodiella citrinella]|uniref:Importin-13 n=1 Tax=Antrodiella citrinella TaxID=2447956 RepID=A0A4S4MM59_9APHY|nr:hypothetical protein EUX98_g7175 [Antrodiella citrinella]